MLVGANTNVWYFHVLKVNKLMHLQSQANFRSIKALSGFQPGGRDPREGRLPFF